MMSDQIIQVKGIFEGTLSLNVKCLTVNHNILLQSIHNTLFFRDGMGCNEIRR